MFYMDESSVTVLRQRLTHFNSAQNLKMRQSLARQFLAKDCMFMVFMQNPLKLRNLKK